MYSGYVRIRGESVTQIPSALNASKQTQATTAQEPSEMPESSNVQVDAEHDALAKRVLRKIDWRLIPLMFITYNLNFMDKTILSSASVFGLREDNVCTPYKMSDILAANFFFLQRV